MTDTATLCGLLIHPAHVFLVTGKRRKRWLSDRYVMFDVTTAAAVQDLGDGEYKLTKRGFTRIDDDALASIGKGKLPPVDKLVQRYGSDWLPLRQTPWLRQHDGLGYLVRLCYTQAGEEPQPVLFSAAVLDTASELYGPRIIVEKAADSPPVRISQRRNGRPSVVGYLAPVRLDGIGADEDAARLMRDEALDSQP
jgi:hypothetical protein